jgi:hypothetical protein
MTPTSLQRLISVDTMKLTAAEQRQASMSFYREEFE